MPVTRSPRRGIALPGALFALLLLGAITAGSMHTVLRDQRSSRQMLAESVAFAAAQTALFRAASALTPSEAQRLSVGEEIVLPSPSGDSAVIARLSGRTWLVTAKRRIDSTGVHRQVAVIVELASPTVTARGAIATNGVLAVESGASIRGEGARDCDDSVNGAGVVVTAAGRLDLSRCPAGNCVRGYPALVEMQMPATAALGDGGWERLAELAGSVARGDARLMSGQGDGILMVDGDLEIGGDARFRGIVVVRGELTMSGAARVEGAILILDADGDGVGSTMNRGAEVSYSHCAVVAAVAASTRLRRLRARSWTELY